MASSKMGAKEILAAFFDDGKYSPLFGGQAGALAAFGQAGGQSAYAVCQTGQAMAAADTAVCRRVLRLAGQTGNPVVTFYNAPGAKLDEGLESLAQARRLSAGAARQSGVVPQIAVVVGVCGASSAIAAAGADICVMAKDAELFLTPPFLASAAGAGKKGAGNAESAVRAGVASMVAEDTADAVRKAARLVAMLPQNNLAETPAFEYSAPAKAFGAEKYSGTAAIEALADAGSAVELFAGFGDGITTSLCTVAGNVAGIAAANGPDTMLGMLCAARAARFARLCDAYSIPLVTVLNTGGFVVSSESDEAGTLRQAARLAATYADATCARVAVLAGRTFGAVYAALGSADLTIALQGSVTAPADPKAAVTVLYKKEIEDSGKPIEAETATRAAAYEKDVASADALLKDGLADLVAAPADLRDTLVSALEMLSTKRAQRLPKKHGNMPL